MDDNPLLEAFEALDPADRSTPSIRDQLIGRYSFAIPSDAALRHLADAAGSGIVEVGAGTGYWAAMLSARGVHVTAYDVAPPRTPNNRWFAESDPWFPVKRHDESIVSSAPPAMLLLVWPTRNEAWPFSAARRYHEAGGDTIAFVGEGPGGRTGDDSFHALLGEIERCNQCAYHVATSPCVCDIEPLWVRSSEMAIPVWPGYTDRLRIYRPRPRRGLRRFGGSARSAGRLRRRSGTP